MTAKTSHRRRSIADASGASTGETLAVGGAGLAVGAVAVGLVERRTRRTVERRRHAKAMVRSWTRACRRSLSMAGSKARPPYTSHQLREDLTVRLIGRVEAVGEDDLLDALVALEELLVSHERGEVDEQEVRAGLRTVEALTARDEAGGAAMEADEDDLPRESDQDDAPTPLSPTAASPEQSGGART